MDIFQRLSLRLEFNSFFCADLAYVCTCVHMCTNINKKYSGTATKFEAARVHQEKNEGRKKNKINQSIQHEVQKMPVKEGLWLKDTYIRRSDIKHSYQKTPSWYHSMRILFTYGFV